MNARVVFILIALLLAAGAMWWTAQQDRQAGAAPEASRLFPELTLETLNALDRVALTHQSARLELRRQDGVWQVADFHDHPADPVAMRKLLTAALEAEKVEGKTAKPEHYARLGVEDPGPGASSRLLELAGDAGEWRLIAGNNSPQIDDGQIVRKPDEAQSWLINRRLSLPADPQAWLDEQIVHLEPDGIRSAFIETRQAGTPVALARAERGKELAMADGASIKAAHLARQITAVPEYLRFKAVEPRENAPPSGDERLRAEYETFDGLRITLELYKHAIAPPAAPPAAELESADEDAEDATEEEAEPPPPIVEVRLLASAGATGSASPEVAARAAALNANFARWVYTISDFLYANLNRTEADLMK